MQQIKEIESPLLSPVEACGYLRIKMATFHKMKNLYGIPVVRMGKRTLYTVEALDEFIQMRLEGTLSLRLIVGRS